MLGKEMKTKVLGKTVHGSVDSHSPDLFEASVSFGHCVDCDALRGTKTIPPQTTNGENRPRPSATPKQCLSSQ